MLGDFHITGLLGGGSGCRHIRLAQGEHAQVGGIHVAGIILDLHLVAAVYYIAGGIQDGHACAG